MRQTQGIIVIFTYDLHINLATEKILQFGGEGASADFGAITPLNGK
ncbi:hypothetical protein HMPREF9374_0571 [Desmospora sp. 8437]|nr:hypothetical protein HMPREF9374_0571 [Desmospora sp. 8437]